ncbi:MAG: site-2 protease family protein [bacterium]|nr:site-2 protease family protein [bacterium]
MESFIFIIFQVLVVLFSIVLHEVSHGVMANSLGDPTAKVAGRLTLNPIKHLDFFGSIILPFVLYTISQGTFVFGYAKPVPYNPLNLRDQRYGPAKVAMAGPLTNLAIALLMGMVLRFLPDGMGNANTHALLGYAVLINLVLAVFNLMPVPPLDGHWLALTFAPRLAYFFQRFGMILFFVLILFVFPLFSPLILRLFELIIGS